MTFENQVCQNLAPLITGHDVEFLETGGGDPQDSPAYLVLRINNVGLQLARDEIGTVIIRVFPAYHPRQKWPIDYLKWLIEAADEIPATLSNRSLEEWCMWLVEAFVEINDAFSEARLSDTLLRVDQIATAQRQRFNAAFANDPSILSKK